MATDKLGRTGNQNLARAMAMAQPAAQAAKRLPKESIHAALQNQQSMLLQKGQLASEKFDKIRQRHIWSTYYFTPLTGGAIDGTGNPYFVRAGRYELFTSGASQNGQGLPSGFQLDSSDTNLPNAGNGRVSDDQNFSIWEMGCTVLACRQDVIESSPTTMSDGEHLVEDVDEITTNCVLGIKYLTNVVPLGKLGEFAQAGGPDMTGRTLLSYAASTTEDAGPPVVAAGGLGQGAQLASPWDYKLARTAQNAGNLPASPGLRRKLDIPIFLRNAQTFSFQIIVPRPFIIRSPEEGGLGAFAVRVDWWAVESFREQG